MADPLYCPWIIGAPCMKSEVWAAWWQAAGSVVAIFVAAWVPANIAKRERLRIERENADHASSLAFVLEPALRGLWNDLLQAAAQLEEAPDRFLLGEGVRLVIPDALSKRLIDLHILGKAARPIQKAIVATNSLISTINAQGDALRYDWIDEDDEESPIQEPVQILKKRIEAATEATQSAISILQDVHGV